jgi:hypothetical protein
MRILILAAVIAALPASALAHDACKAPRKTSAAAPGVYVGGPVRAQRLDAMPDADLARTVLRKVDGCDYVEVVRSGVSTGGPFRERPVWKLSPAPQRTPAERPR